MKTIELTQGKVALVDDVDYVYLMQWKWQAHTSRTSWRPTRRTRVEGKWTSRYMYHDIAERMGMRTAIVDHVDQNPLNNRRSNLRAATYSQNGHNCGPRQRSTTGVKGVSFHKEKHKYHAQIQVASKKYHVGYYKTLAEAAVAIQKKRQELVGEFACA